MERESQSESSRRSCGFEIGIARCGAFTSRDVEVAFCQRSLPDSASLTWEDNPLATMPSEVNMFFYFLYT